MKQIIVLFMFILFLAGCNSKKPDIITYDIKRTDYVDAINATGTIQAVNNALILAPLTLYTNVVQLTYLIKDGAHVMKGDTVCAFAVPPEIVTILETYNTDLEKMEGDLNKLQVSNAMELALLNAQIATNKAQLAITMLDSLKMKFAPPAEKRLLALKMQKANIEKTRLQKKFSAQKRISSQDVLKLSSRIMIQKSRIKMLQTQINALKLLSPVDGTVMHIENYRLDGNNFSIGKIEEGISTISNMSVLQIPDMKSMQVLTEVPEADYKKIQNGQKVFINVEAASNLLTTGKIKRKSLQKTNPQVRTNVKTYEVIIGIDSCHSKMKPGLSAQCHIVIDQVKDTIVIPLSAIFEKDSSKIVYVAKGNKFTPVKVETGISNGTIIIISKGLTGNETLALSQPSHKMILNELIPENKNSTDSSESKKDSLMKKLSIKN